MNKKHIVLPVVLLSGLGLTYLSMTTPKPATSESTATASGPDTKAIVQVEALPAESAHMLSIDPNSVAHTEQAAPSANRISTATYQGMSAYGPLPAYLADVEIQPIDVDAQGHLILSANIKSVFDHFLLASQEEGLDIAIARAHEYLSMVLPEPADSQARDLLIRYIDFRYALDEALKTVTIDPEAKDRVSRFEQALTVKRAVRREFLSADEVSAFWGNEEAYEEYSLARLKIYSDESLNDEQRFQAMAQAESHLPPSQRQTAQRARERAYLERQVQRMRNQGASEQDIHQLRVGVYGEAGAQARAFLDDASPEWQQRVQGFREHVAQIAQDSSLSPDEKQIAIKQASEANFTEKEQVKLMLQGLKERVQHYRQASKENTLASNL
ncbi:MAG: lipase secretion chaperone [Oleiphilaceae bacterium]|nr:lipase secretion chaperone [Oleiphilaceae bacterium]